MDEDDFGPDQNDKLFNELDDIVDFAKASINRGSDFNRKFDVSLDVMNLMLEEVPENAKITRQGGGRWIAEVIYHQVHFIHVNGKRKLELWDEILGRLDEK